MILSCICSITVFSDCRAGRFLRLTPCWLTASLQVVRTSLQTGSPSANSKSPLILHSHMAWDWRLKQTHVRKDVWLLKDYLCLQDACKCSNFLFLWFRVHSWNEGCWPIELLEKYETAASLRLAVALLLGTQTETAINLSEKKPLFTLNHVNEWDHEIEAWRFPSPHLAASSQPRDVTSLSGVRGQVTEVEINGGFPGGL